MKINNLIDLDIYINEQDKLCSRPRELTVLRDNVVKLFKFNKIRINSLYKNRKFINSKKCYCIICVKLYELKNDINKEWDYKTKSIIDIKNKELVHYLPDSNEFYLNEVIRLCTKEVDGRKVKIRKYKNNDKTIILYFVPKEYRKLFYDLISIGIKCKKANELLSAWTRVSQFAEAFADLREQLDEVKRALNKIDDMGGMGNVNSLIIATLDLGLRPETVNKSLGEKLINYIEDGKIYKNKIDILDQNRDKLNDIIWLYERSSFVFSLLKNIKTKKYLTYGPLESIDTYLVYKAYLLLKKYEIVYTCKSNAHQIGFLAEALRRWLILENPVNKPVVEKDEDPPSWTDKGTKMVPTWGVKFEEMGIEALMGYFDEGRTGVMD